MNSLKTPKPLLAARMAFPLAASLITVLLGEWIAPRCADGGHRYKLYFPPCRGLSAGMAVPVSGLAAAGLDLPAAAAVYAGHGGTGLRTLRGEFLYPAAAR